MNEHFSNGKTAKNVTTVGEVIAELSQLPGELPVRSSFGRSIDLVLFNINKKDRHLAFEDGGDFDNTV